jgi:hypothetical protein
MSRRSLKSLKKAKNWARRKLRIASELEISYPKLYEITEQFQTDDDLKKKFQEDLLQDFSNQTFTRAAQQKIKYETFEIVPHNSPIINLVRDLREAGVKGLFRVHETEHTDTDTDPHAAGAVLEEYVNKYYPKAVVGDWTMDSCWKQPSVGFVPDPRDRTTLMEMPPRTYCKIKNIKYPDPGGKVSGAFFGRDKCAELEHLLKDEAGIGVWEEKLKIIQEIWEIITKKKKQIREFQQKEKEEEDEEMKVIDRRGSKSGFDAMPMGARSGVGVKVQIVSLQNLLFLDKEELKRLDTSTLLYNTNNTVAAVDGDRFLDNIYLALIIKFAEFLRTNDKHTEYLGSAETAGEIGEYTFMQLDKSDKPVSVLVHEKLEEFEAAAAAAKDGEDGESGGGGTRRLKRKKSSKRKSSKRKSIKRKSTRKKSTRRKSNSKRKLSKKKSKSRRRR